MSSYLLQEQHGRREKLYSSYRQVARNWFNERGEWIAPKRSLIAEGVGGLRELYWHAIGMLDSSDKKDIWCIMPVLEKPRDYRCSFAPFAALQILNKYPEKISEKAKGNLIDYISWNLPKSSTCDFQFHGYNDNMPAMKTFVLLVAGEMLGEQNWIHQGIANLCQLRSLLMRRAFLSEFNSPTYSSITFMALSEIANYAKNQDAVKLARAAAERVFADIAFHWHRETSGSSGPFSRAYTLDSVGHCGGINTCMWQILGDEVFINPLRYYFTDEYKNVVLHHKGSLPFLQVSSVWNMAADLLIFPELIEYLRKPRYPRLVQGTVETGPASPGETKLNKKDGSYKFVRTGNFSHPFMNYSTTSLLQKRWTMGTSTGYMGDGAQSELFYLRYSLNETPSGVNDIRCVYTKYLINETPVYSDYEENGKRYITSVDIVPNKGAGFAFQHENTAMLCCKPIPHAVDGLVSSLRLQICLYCKHNEPATFELRKNNIIIEDHGIHLLFKPMINLNSIADINTQEKVEITRDRDWIYIDIFNYDGLPIKITEDEIQRFSNGFVCEISENAFSKDILDAVPVDEYYLEQRRISYKRNGLELQTAYDPLSMGIRHMTVNERAVNEPVFDVNNYNISKLPWSDSPLPNNPQGINWEMIITNRDMPN